MRTSQFQLTLWAIMGSASVATFAHGFVGRVQPHQARGPRAHKSAPSAFQSPNMGKSQLGAGNEAAMPSDAGAFDYTAELTGKGKLVVSFEPTNTVSPKPPPNPMPEVFPGVSLPKGEAEPPSFKNAYTNAQVDRFGAVRNEVFFSSQFLGKDKTDPTAVTAAQDLTIDLNNLEAALGSSKDDYNFFGNKDFARSLVLLLKNNPFMAPALTQLPNGEGYELKTYHPEGEPEEKPTMYRTILSTLNGVGHHVNFQFDKNMEKVTGYQMYDDITGKQVALRDVDLQTAASSALYNIFFFASCIHATIHVLHYLYTSAFQVASSDFEEMNQWANDYAKNIPWKYLQVGTLLLTEPQNQLSIITGGSGMGSSQAVRYILKAVLQGWGQVPTADGFFFGAMMNISKEKVEKDGVILTEFIKHYNLVTPFSKSASDSLKSINPEQFKVAEHKLSKYLKQCGDFKSNLSSLGQWIEVMAVTGAMHGGTLSYTRLMAMPEILRWRNYVSSKWNFPDAFLLFSALGTIVGMEDGRHVMTDSDNVYASPLQQVLEDFNKKTTKLKKSYQGDLLRNPEFNDFGWILSDYCLDDFDGKQLTISTYV